MLSLSPNPKQNISYSFYFPRISSPLTCQLSLQHLIKVKQFYFIYISSSLQPPTTHSLFFLCLYFFFLLFVCFFLLQSAPLLPPTIFITFRSILLSSHACVFLLQIQVHTSQFPFVNFFSFIFFLPRPFFPKISLSLSENFPIFIFWPGTLIFPGIPKFHLGCQIRPALAEIQDGADLGGHLHQTTHRNEKFWPFRLEWNRIQNIQLY